MSQHQPEDSCGVAQCLSLHRESDPREPNPTVWSWQSFLKSSQVRANAPSRAWGCFAGFQLCKEATPEMLRWWMKSTWSQQPRREAGDG